MSFDYGDFVRPGTLGIGVGFAGGISPLGLGKAFAEVIQSILQGRAGHSKRLSFGRNLMHLWMDEGFPRRRIRASGLCCLFEGEFVFDGLCDIVD